MKTTMFYNLLREFVSSLDADMMSELYKAANYGNLPERMCEFAHDASHDDDAAAYMAHVDEFAERNHSWLDDMTDGEAFEWSQIDENVLDALANMPVQVKVSPSDYPVLDEQDFALIVLEHIENDTDVWFETLIYRNMGMSDGAFQQHVLDMALHMATEHGLNVLTIEYAPEILGCVSG